MTPRSDVASGGDVREPGPMDVDVLIATASRAETLRETLASLARAARRGGGVHRVIVVDNAGDGETRRVCDRAATELPLRRAVETSGGKSTALNHGLELVDAPLVAFTDDDVIFDESWVESLTAGAGRWPDHQVFGGPVLPRWPEPPPEWLVGSKYSGVAYSVLDPGLDEGPHAGFRPFGPNFAVRREVFDAGVRFDPSIGPMSGEYVMGNETELVERVVSRGKPAVFLPACRVQHTIREEQLTLRWLLRRARRYGRSMVVHDRRREGGGSPSSSAPRWLYTGIAEYALRSLSMAVMGRRTRALDLALDAAVDVGRLEAHG